MININFVPDDYIQNNESRRTNLIYIVLFTIVMVALFGSFATVKIRQKAFNKRENIIDRELSQRKGEIKKVEQLQAKRNQMWNTALTTAELIEPVSRSLLLASLTNNLPNGVSLLRLNLIQKEPQGTSSFSSQASTKYESLKVLKTKGADGRESLERRLETHIDIEGIAPSDIEVAAYIERLDNSILVTDVALVESTELESKSNTSQRTQKFRQFRLTAMLNKNVEQVDEYLKNLVVHGGI